MQSSSRVNIVGNNLKPKLFAIGFSLLLVSNSTANANTVELGEGKPAENQECYDAMTKGSLHEEWNYPGTANSTWADSYYLINGWIYSVGFNRTGFGGKKLDMHCTKWKLR